MGKESFGHEEDARVDRENVKAGLPIRKKFVPIEDVPSGISTEDTAIERVEARDKAEVEKQAEFDRFSKKWDELQAKRAKGEEITTEPNEPEDYQGQPLNPSTSISGSGLHVKSNWSETDLTKTDKKRGAEKDTAKEKWFDRKRRTEHKASPKK